MCLPVFHVKSLEGCDPPVPILVSPMPVALPWLHHLAVWYEHNMGIKQFRAGLGSMFKSSSLCELMSGDGFSAWGLYECSYCPSSQSISQYDCIRKATAKAWSCFMHNLSGNALGLNCPSRSIQRRLLWTEMDN
jgi:hypothetical protein